ncbi:MAG: hypothetical protein HMLKMBBP_03167 [Planctomycetes bacterium]|nr:hypothetical protein [Planctomycetota bacterium]
MFRTAHTALAALAAALLLAAGPAVPAGAGDGPPAGVDPKAWKEWTAVIDRFFAAEGDGGRLLVEGDAAKLAPLPAEAVAPLAERIFELAAKTGPKLKKTGSDFFYDKKAKKGLYMAAPSAKKPCGLLIALHGGGEGQGDAGSAFGIWSGATSNGMTVIAPEVMRKVSSAWNEEKEEEFVLDLIDAAKRTFPVDPDRIYVAGHSMGGDGSWMIGGRNADLFAAAAPLAGSVMPYMKEGKLNRRETPLSDYLGLMEGVLPNLMYVPYWIAHSADDRNEAVHPDDIATARLKELQKLFPGRYEHVYDRIDGNGHALPPKGVGPILEWMEKKTRATYPEEVVWETWWPWKRQMHWLYHPEPDDAWRFHAKVTGGNTVEVSATTKPIQGRSEPKELELTILASPKMFDLSKPLRVVSGGKTVFDGPVPRTLWTLLVTAGRRNDRAMWFEGAVTVKLPRTQWHEAWEPAPAAAK